MKKAQNGSTSYKALVALLPAFMASTPDELAHTEPDKWWMDWGPALETFHSEVYASGFMLTDFVWMKHVAEYERIVYQAPEEIDNLTLKRLRELTTGIVRGERFTEGLLPKLAREGIITRILKRLDTLTGGMNDSDSTTKRPRTGKGGECSPPPRALDRKGVWKETEQRSREWGMPGPPGVFVQGARLRLGITQVGLAKMLGVSVKRMSSIENNRIPVDEELAKRIGEALNIGANVFLRDD